MYVLNFLPLDPFIPATCGHLRFQVLDIPLHVLPKVLSTSSIEVARMANIVISYALASSEILHTLGDTYRLLLFRRIRCRFNRVDSSWATLWRPVIRSQTISEGLRNMSCRESCRRPRQCLFHSPEPTGQAPPLILRLFRTPRSPRVVSQPRRNELLFRTTD